MSAPSHRIRQSENIRYGLLAVNTVEALNKLLRDNHLNEDDCATLQKAAEFMGDIADGEDLVTKNSYRGHNSIASMKALDVAIGPLKELQELAQYKKEVADTLRQLATILDEKVQAKSLATENDKRLLTHLVKFFNSLNIELMQSMSRNRTKLGSSSTVRNRQNAVLEY